MMGSFIARTMILVLGYAYPAYECFKCAERKKPDIGQLRFWCQYWMIIAVVTVMERVGDTFILWLPMYTEAKLAFIIYLWYPKTKGTTYVYTTFLRPFVSNHELEIDRHLNELRTRVGDLACHYWAKGSVYVQSRFVEFLNHISSQQSPSTPQQGQAQPSMNHLASELATANYQPAAVVLPINNQSMPPSLSDNVQETSHMDGDANVESGHFIHSVPEAAATGPGHRLRSRQRSRRQQ